MNPPQATIAGTSAIAPDRIRGFLIGLMVQYALGMLTNLFGVPPDDPTRVEPLYSKILFGLHALVGLSLLIGSIYFFIQGRKSSNPVIRQTALYGLLSIFLAFAGGIATILLKDNASEWASFLMSVGFLLSFLTYGRLYFLSR